MYGCAGKDGWSANVAFARFGAANDIDLALVFERSKDLAYYTALLSNEEE